MNVTVKLFAAAKDLAGAESVIVNGNAGMTVSETLNEAIIATIVATPIGAKRRPSIPPRPKSGMKTKMMSSVA